MSGLPDSLRTLGAMLLELAGARAALAAVEMREARAREGRKVALAALAAVFLSIGALLAALLVVLLFWDTHRIAAACGVTLLYLGIGALALLRLRELQRRSSPWMAAGLLLLAWLAKR